jgi:DNA-binding CsgD family transcriptional regulator
MGLKENTVKSYLKAVYAKTGIQGRGALAAAWAAQGAASNTDAGR